MANHAASKARIRRRLMRHAQWVLLVTLLILTAFSVYHVAPAPVAATPAARAAQAAAHDPAMQSVLDYLRAHSGETAIPTPAAPLDAAQQGVMQYVRAHEVAGQPTSLWEQVKQTVLGYLRVHGK